MTQTGVVTGLAVRELWVSFRLLVLLAAYVAAGAFVALVPAPAPLTLERLALGLLAAAIAGAGIAAWSLASERVQGRIGWLVTRSIPRETVLIGWFAALASVTAVGLVAAAALGWLSISASGRSLDPIGFVAVVGGVAAWSWAAIAIGILLGALLRPSLALLTAVLLGAGAAVGGWLTGLAIAPFAALARLPELERPIAIGIQAAGIGLAVTAVALVLARMVLARVDL